MTALSSPPIHALQAGCCVLLATGSGECNIRFYPSLFQLFVERDATQERIDLGYAGTRLLERLLHNPGEVVTREALMDYAWPDRVVGQGSLNQQIYSLRQLFCDEKSREVIQTLPRRGYLFNPNFVLEQDANAPVEQTLPTSEKQPEPTVGPVKRARWPSVMLFLFTLVLGLTTSAWVNENAEQLSVRTIKQGALTLQLIASVTEDLDQLERDSETLAARLAELGDVNLTAMLDNYGGYFHLLCYQHPPAAHLLMFHPSQLASLGDEQLRQCMQ